ncbi:MAG TPA: hypothetical protein VF762_00110 [Blastocatellia bacterium]
MLCPCCGKEITLAARECGCGARFVGRPLDDDPIKVRRFGPVATALLLMLTVAGAVLIVTKWAALAITVIIWAARRAVKLARREPDLYGGYRTAAAALVIATVAGIIAGGYAITRIPKYFDDLETRRIASTHSAMYHVAGLLEDYKRAYGSYPRNLQEFKKVLAETLPADYWNKSIKYQSYTEAIADGSIVRTGLPFNNFELRSAGPDEKEGTDDDIIMRDGAFFTSAEIKKQPIIRNSSAR